MYIVITNDMGVSEQSRARTTILLVHDEALSTRIIIGQLYEDSM